MEAVVVNDSTVTTTGTNNNNNNNNNITVGDEEAQQIPISSASTSTSTMITLESLQKQVREYQDKTDHSMQLLQREIRDLQDRVIACEGQSKSGDGGGGGNPMQPPITLNSSMSRSLMTGNMLGEETGQGGGGGGKEAEREGLPAAAPIPIPTNAELNKRVQLMEDEMKRRLEKLEEERVHAHVPEIQNEETVGERPKPRELTSLFGRITGGGDVDDKLSSDTFTFMMTSKYRSAPWILGFVTFFIQMLLIYVVGAHQVFEEKIPFKVDANTRTGQFFAIIFSIAYQSDIISSLRCVIVFWNNPHWGRIILGREEDDASPPPTNMEWRGHVLFPNSLKFIQGLSVQIITLILILQSDNNFDLFKDFTALLVISETDNIVYGLAVNGYLGKTLQDKAYKIQNIDMEESHDDEHEQRSGGRPPFAHLIRPIILIFLITSMLGIWINVANKQHKGTYFKKEYPKCIVDGSGDKAFKLASEHIGDEKCYGGPLNTFDCQFEGGDCINFNTAYPLCKGNKRINAEELVGNSKCDAEFMHVDCDYDGGDCCPYINDAAFGDGTCDERMNTIGCGYDNGDCLDSNRDFPGCPHDVVFDNPTFGDGQCNGGISSTVRCGYDNGDCNKMRIDYPDCPFDDLSNMIGADDVTLGDGICNGNVYVVEECGFEYGDCNQGQVGQSIYYYDGDVQSRDILYFNKVHSLDGSTLALGLYKTGKDGRFYEAAPGVVKVWRFNTDRKLWLELGETIESPSGQGSGDSFGQRMSMSANGNHLAISSKSGLQVFEVKNTSGNEKWSQMGQTLKSISDDFYSYGIISTDGSRVALIYDSNHIWIYNFFSNEERWVPDNDLGVIKVDDTSDSLSVELRFANDSTLLFTEFDGAFVKTFRQSNADVAWAQIGQDIEKVPSSSSMAISLNGNRIATNTTSGVQVLDYDGTEWRPVGQPVVSASPIQGQEFGYSFEMSADGNLLVVGLNHPDCRPDQNEFEANKCTKSSGALFELYTYDPKNNRFITTPLRKGVEAAKEVSDGSILRGLHFSLSKGDNGNTLISVSNYNLVDEVVFVDVIDLDKLYYTKCAVDKPDWIGDGGCDGIPPYNTEACGFDGGDCVLYNKKYPDCDALDYAYLVGDGKCHDELPYDSVACGIDGGDCVPKPVDGYSNCFVHTPDYIGNGYCHDWPPFNTAACEFDGGDCDRKPVVGYPDCSVHRLDWIGDGGCDDWPPYNTEACGFDGGDCVPKPVGGYPNCLVHEPDWIGDEGCDDYSPYNTEACGFDGGDCVPKPVDIYPDCFVIYPDWIGDGVCNDFAPYNTEACGNDGGDCP